MGSPQADRALDDPNLAIRLRHRRVCVFNALQMVSSRNVMQAIVPAKTGGQTGLSASHAKILHTAMICCLITRCALLSMQEIYGDYCDVQRADQSAAAEPSVP